MRIVPYAPQFRDGIFALMHASRFKQCMWNWQFGQLEERTPVPALVLVENGVVVGFNGAMPVSVSVAGKSIDALWSCDFFVAQQCRGKGLGSEMKAELKSLAPLIMALNISNLAAPVLRKSGWQAINGVSVARKMYRADGKKRMLLALQFFNTVRRLRWRFAPAKLAVMHERVLPSPLELDDLWQRVADGYDCIVVRNDAYLRWRYMPDSAVGYQFLVARDQGGLLCGLAVVREFEGAVYLVDLVAGAADTGVRSAFVKKMRECFPEGVRFSCVTSDRLLLNALEAFGFYVSRDQPRFYVWANPALGNLPFKTWFVMDGDSDGEMLAAAHDIWGRN